MDRLLNATPRQILVAAIIILGAAVLVAELVVVVDRVVMARYDPAKLAEEVEEYLGERERDEPAD